jgi:hypothetical protein
VEQRKVIRPTSPETSELIDLVQGGSMPPGNCSKVPKKDVELLKEWVRQGAAALPSTHEESYVLWSIVRDLSTRTDQQKRSIRYLSLNHVLARESTSRSLAEQRESLERMLREFVPADKQPPQLRSIEKTESVFRVDLQELGWERTPYPESRLNLFDLILLEYPYGRLPTGSPFYYPDSELLNFLQKAGQVRPIPYVRADWLAGALVQSLSPLRSDLLNVLKKKPQGRSEQGSSRRLEPLSVSDITGEWYDRGGWDEYSLRGAGSFLALPTHPPRGDEKERRVFHEEYLTELLSREAKSGIPILPLDGLDYRPKPTPDVLFRAIDFRQRDNADPPAKDPFAPGDRMSLWIKIEWSGVAERIIINKDGRICKPTLKEIINKDGRLGKPAFFSPENETVHDSDLLTFEAGRVKHIRDQDQKGDPKGFEMVLEDPKEEEDVEYHILYAYSLDDLKQANFPKGTLLHAEGIHDRFVHPLYELQPDGQIKPPDPSKLVKVVLPVRTRRPKN